MESYSVWIWLGILVMMIGIEIATVQLTTIWFAAGALTSLLLAAFGVHDIIIQIIVFLAVSVLTLLIARPLVKRKVNKKMTPTNYDRNIGQEGVVTEEINNIAEKGAIRLNGLEWTARSEDNSVIPVGTVVTVKTIKGAKAFVEKK